MKVIGKASKYYTLWLVSEPYRHYIDAHRFVIKQDCSYVKNLSLELEEAKKKIEGEYKIDLNLRGRSGTVKGYTESKLHTDISVDLFPYGKYYAEPIGASTDIWHLERLADDKAFPSHAHNAKNRLKELGKLFEYKGQTFGSKQELDLFKKREIIDSYKKGHFFEDGQKKVHLALTLIGHRYVESKGPYGGFFITAFIDDDLRYFLYKGSVDLPDAYGWEIDGKYELYCTIKHTLSFNSEQAITQIQRVKV